MNEIITDENSNVFKNWGKTHIIEKIPVKNKFYLTLKNLKPNESVCAGDGKTYYCLLTKK